MTSLGYETGQRVLALLLIRNAQASSMKVRAAGPASLTRRTRGESTA